MRVGYACLTLGVIGIDYRSCLKKNAGEDVLASLIAHNLSSLTRAVLYNTKNCIRLFRITSDLIPFGSSPVNTLDWPGLYAAELAHIGQLIRRGGLRVSMHPGQYTVLNSPRQDVYQRAADDLVYHCRILDSLALDRSHKIILHVGGRYDDKASAMRRFAEGWRRLGAAVRARLVIENDDKIFTAREVFELGRQLGIPVVFDSLHHELNHEPDSPGPEVWIKRCRETWLPADGPQEIHYSQQHPERRSGSHSDTIELDTFIAFCRNIGDSDLDIMLEVKCLYRSYVPVNC